MRTVSDEWDDWADDWDDDPAARTYAKAAFASLHPVLDRAGIDLAGARVIDFGCGTGLLTERLVAAGTAAVTGIDTSPAMLDVLRTKAADRAWTTVTTTTALAEAPTGNDLVVCSSVCSFLDDYPATAAELADLLRPGGLFVQWDWERPEPSADDAGTHDVDEDAHGLTRSAIEGALTSAGLVDVEVATAFEIAFEGATMAPLIGHGRRPA